MVGLTNFMTKSNAPNVIKKSRIHSTEECQRVLYDPYLEQKPAAN